MIRRIIEQRKVKGKRLSAGGRFRHAAIPTANLLVKAYRQEAERQSLLVRKAHLTENRLLFVISALKQLFQDENFLNLLRAEGLASLPTYLADRLKQHPRA